MRSSGWAGLVQVSNPIASGNKTPYVNVYIECTAKNRRKATRILEGIAKSYYPGYREHVVLETSPLDSSGAILEAAVLDYRIDELIADDTVISMDEKGHPVGAKVEKAKQEPSTPLLPAPAQPVGSVTTVVTVMANPFPDNVLAVMASERSEYDQNIRRAITNFKAGGTKL